MSVKPICMWKSGELSHLKVTKTENGFVVSTWTVGPILQPDCSGRVKVEREQICKSYPEVLELLAEYFAWDTSEAAPDEPASASGMGFARSKFPDTFVRFDIEGSGVWAVLQGLQGEVRHPYTGLAREIDTRKGARLSVNEAAKWDALLEELRCRTIGQRPP